VPDDGGTRRDDYRAAGLVDQIDAFVVCAHEQPVYVGRRRVHHGRQEERTVRVTVQPVRAHLGVHVRDRRRPIAHVRHAGQIGGHVVVPAGPPGRVRRVQEQEERQVDGGRRVPGLRRVQHYRPDRPPGGRVVPEQQVVPAKVAVAQHGQRLDRPQQFGNRVAAAIQHRPHPVQPIARVLGRRVRVQQRVHAPVTGTCVVVTQFPLYRYR